MKRKFLVLGMLVFGLMFVAACGSSGGTTAAPSLGSDLALTGSFTATTETETSSNVAVPMSNNKSFIKAAGDTYTITCTLLEDPTKVCSFDVISGATYSATCASFVGKDFKCDVATGGTTVGSFSVAANQTSSDYSTLLSTAGASLGLVLDYDTDTLLGNGYVSSGELGVSDPTVLSTMTGEWQMACEANGLAGDEIGKEKCGDGQIMYIHVSGGGAPVEGSLVGIWPSKAGWVACGSPNDEIADVSFQATVDGVPIPIVYTNKDTLRASYLAIYNALAAFNPAITGIIDNLAAQRMGGQKKQCEEMQNSNPVSDANCKFVKVIPNANGFIDFGAITYAASENYEGSATSQPVSCGDYCPPEITGGQVDIVIADDGNPIFLVCKDPRGYGAMHMPARDITRQANITYWAEKFGANIGCPDNFDNEINREKYRMIGDLINMEPMRFQFVDQQCLEFTRRLAQEAPRFVEQYAQMRAQELQNPNFKMPPDMAEAAGDDLIMTLPEAEAFMGRFSPPEIAILCDSSLEGVRDDLKAVVSNSCTARTNWDFFCDEKGNCSEKMVCNDSEADNGGCFNAAGQFTGRVSQRHDVMTLHIKNDPYFDMTAQELMRFRIRGEGGKQDFCKVSHSIKFMGQKVDDNTILAELKFNDKDNCWGEKKDQSGQVEKSSENPNSTMVVKLVRQP